MEIKVKKLPKSEVEVTVEMSVEDLKPYLEKACESLTKKTPMEGFRPGKAPYDSVKAKFGEMSIYQEAAYIAIDKTIYDVLDEQKIAGIGQPKIDVDKIAPGNPLIYRAVVPVIPSVKIGDFSKVKVAKNKVEVTDEEIDKTVQQLLKMRAKEVLVERECKKGDKVEIDFDISLNKVPIEHGSGKKYPLVLGDGFMVDGFEEPLFGMKKGEEKEFKLKFPKDYGNKNLANRECDVKVKLLSVYNLELPKLDKEFLATIGKFETEEELKKQIKDNILLDKTDKENLRFDIEMYDKLVEQCTFEDLPEVLLENESHKMLQELEESVVAKGLKFEDYLNHLKKTREELKLDFSPEAAKRIKVALMNKQVAIDNKIEVDPKEVELQLTKMKEMYKDNKEAIKQIENKRYYEYIKSSLINKKVIEFLKKEVMEKAA